MRNISSYFIGLATFFALAGMAYGMYMAGSEDHVFAGAHAHNNLHVSITVTQPDAKWHGLTGRIDPVKLHALDVPDDTLYYLCGPKGMVEDMSALLHDLGVPMNRIIFEKWW